MLVLAVGSFLQQDTLREGSHLPVLQEQLYASHVSAARSLVQRRGSVFGLVVPFHMHALYQQLVSIEFEDGCCVRHCAIECLVNDGVTARCEECVRVCLIRPVGRSCVSTSFGVEYDSAASTEMNGICDEHRDGKRALPIQAAKHMGYNSSLGGGDTQPTPSLFRRYLA